MVVVTWPVRGDQDQGADSALFYAPFVALMQEASTPPLQWGLRTGWRIEGGRRRCGWGGDFLPSATSPMLAMVVGMIQGSPEDFSSCAGGPNWPPVAPEWGRYKALPLTLYSLLQPQCWHKEELSCSSAQAEKLHESTSLEFPRRGKK